MDEDHDRMYVGSKDYILSLDLNDINKEPLIVSMTVLLISTFILSLYWMSAVENYTLLNC